MKTPNFVSGKVDIASQMHKSVQAIDQSRLVMQVIGYRSLKPSEAVIVRFLAGCFNANPVPRTPKDIHSWASPRTYSSSLFVGEKDDRTMLQDSIGCRVAPRGCYESVEMWLSTTRGRRRTETSASLPQISESA